MAKTEQDHVKPAASGQLVGKGPMTEEAKAAFLAQTRVDEQSYTGDRFFHENQGQFSSSRGGEERIVVSKQAITGHTENVEILKKDIALVSKVNDLNELSPEVRSRLAEAWDRKVPGMADTREYYHSFEVMQDTASPKDLAKFRLDLLDVLNKRVEFETTQAEIHRAKLDQHIATQTSLQAQPDVTVTVQQPQPSVVEIAASSEAVENQPKSSKWYRSTDYSSASVGGHTEASIERTSASHLAAMQQNDRSTPPNEFKPHVNDSLERADVWLDGSESNVKSVAASQKSWYGPPIGHGTVYENPAWVPPKKSSLVVAGLGLKAIGINMLPIGGDVAAQTFEATELAELAKQHQAEGKISPEQLKIIQGSLANAMAAYTAGAADVSGVAQDTGLKLVADDMKQSLLKTGMPEQVANQYALPSLSASLEQLTALGVDAAANRSAINAEMSQSGKLPLSLALNADPANMSRLGAFEKSYGGPALQQMLAQEGFGKLAAMPAADAQRLVHMVAHGKDPYVTVDADGAIKLADNKPVLAKNDEQAFRQIVEYVVTSGDGQYSPPADRSPALQNAVSKFEKTYNFLAKDGGLSNQDFQTMGRVLDNIHTEMQANYSAKVDAKQEPELVM